MRVVGVLFEPRELPVANEACLRDDVDSELGC